MSFVSRIGRPWLMWLTTLVLLQGSLGQTPPTPALTLAVPIPAPTPALLPATTPVPAPPLAPVSFTDPQGLSKLSSLGQAPDWSALEAFQKVLSKQEFEDAWRTTYASEGPFPPPYEIQGDAVLIPTGNPAKPTIRIEFKTGAASAAAEPPPRYWRRADELPLLNRRPPLSDIHIAIDPGHIGGAYARMEERYLSFHPGEAIQEGDLALLTGQILAERLKALGAYVSLVRDKPEPVTEQRPANLELVARQILKDAGIPEPALKYDGLTGDAKVITAQWQAEKLFYRVSEIHARAAKVNQQIKPDVVLCLHLNAEEWGVSEAPQYSPVNHMHVMVNGCYAPVELQQQDVRFEMFKRLFTRIHEEELPLATAVAEGMAQTTHLPAYVYTTPIARHAGPGPYVYARNLLANRLFLCPVVYLEPFVMNHEETYRRLLLGHFAGQTLVAGRLQGSAIEDYVSGVVKGLLAYYQSHRRSS
ncbi:MAG: hypothetical protein U0984_11145 [Prosthecobacter sp.]|nr:hypothetical protein [Prosthecobacter sp.]